MLQNQYSRSQAVNSQCEPLLCDTLGLAESSVLCLLGYRALSSDMLQNGYCTDVSVQIKEPRAALAPS